MRYSQRKARHGAAGRCSKRSKGSVLVLVSCSFVALMGFCALGVDYGILVATKNQLQRTCDAAALAGASELPASDDARKARAKHQAELLAFQNKVAVSEVTVSFPETTSIRVTANRNVDTLFARALGVFSRKVAASALAGRSTVSGVPGAGPLAITTKDYEKYKGGESFEERMIDNNRQDFEDGTFVALDLRPGNSGKSPAIFQDDLTNGYDGQVKLNQQVNNSLNASLNAQGAKMGTALDDRFRRALGSPWLDEGLGIKYTFPQYPAGNPRIITILVADENDQDNSNPMITARFFAPVYVESFQERGKDRFFLRMRILPKLDYSSSDPNVALGDASTPDTGVGVIRLLS